jgi:hypothetical protein
MRRKIKFLLGRCQTPGCKNRYDAISEIKLIDKSGKTIGKIKSHICIEHAKELVHSFSESEKETTEKPEEE